MALKFNRGYKLTVDLNNGDTMVIDSTISPFTLEFDIQRDNFASTNLASLRIYNLGPKTRGNIWKGPADTNFKRKMFLHVGYGSDSSKFPLIFQGALKQCWSFREGNSFITQIESFDGGAGFIHGNTNVSVSTSDTYASVASDLINSLGQYGIKKGVIGNSVAQMGNIPIESTYSENTFHLLTMNYKGFFVDLETAHILSDTENLGNNPLIISSAIGLLGTPIVQSMNLVNVQILFSPQFKVGQNANLQSSTAKNLNKIYRVNSVKHRGIVSPTVGGQAITTLGLYTTKVIT